MATDIESLLRLQAGWKEPEPMPPSEVAFSPELIHEYRDRAAQVLKDVHAGHMAASDEVPPTEALRGYLDSLQKHFGFPACQTVAVFHGLSGSTFCNDHPDIIKRLDFPVPFHLFGEGGFEATKLSRVTHSSSLPQLPAVVLQTPAFLRIKSEAQ